MLAVTETFPTIRPIHDSRQLEAILTWAARWREEQPDGEMPEGLAYIIEDWDHRPGDSAYGAFDGEGRFMGGIFARFWKNDMHSYGFVDENSAEIAIAVSPDHRKTGIGTKLLQTLQQQSIHRAASGEMAGAALSLSVEKENTTAKRLYEKCGFQTYQTGDDDIIMTWKPDMAIEQMNIRDLPEVLDLWRECDGICLYEQAEDSPEALEEFLNANAGLNFLVRARTEPRRSDNKDATIPSEIDFRRPEKKLSAEPVVAAVICGCDHRRGYVHHLAVHRSFRKLGLAQSLLESISNALASRSINKMHLFVLNSNVSAKEFYRHTGWLFRDDIALFSLPTSKLNED